MASNQVETDWQVVQEVDPDRYRVYIVIRYLSLLGIVAHASFVPLFWLAGFPHLSLFNVFSVLAWVWARHLNEKGARDLAVAWITFEVVAHAVFATSSLGWNSGFQYYLLPMVPFTIFNQRLTGRTLGLQTFGLLAIYVWLNLTQSHVAPNLSRDSLNSFFLINVSVVFTALGMLSFYFRQASVTAETKLLEVASIDALTGLPNRRRLHQILQADRERNERLGEMSVLGLSDIDHFKTFNDTYGHDCGDEVLKKVAQTLRHCLRERDVVGRWGGEEFLILLHSPSLSDAAAAAERMRVALEEQVFEFEEHRLKITMTFGLAPCCPTATLDQALKQADQALYQGKENGRNRVVTWES